jgi:hypothetical protein
VIYLTLDNNQSLNYFENNTAKGDIPDSIYHSIQLEDYNSIK